MIAIDIDNTICDTLAVLRARLNPPLVAERVADWSPYGSTAEFWATYGNEVYAEVQPFPGAAEAVRELARQEGVTYVTARPRDAGEATVAWLARHGFPGGAIVFEAREKGRVAAQFGCRLAIEDDPRQVESYRAAGIPVLVPRQGYNADVACAWRFEEWYEVLIHFPLPRVDRGVVAAPSESG